MTYGDFKDLPRDRASDKVLHDKTFRIASNPKNDEYQCKVTSVIYKFFDKKAWDTSNPTGTGTKIFEN